ncbi:MAG: CHAD domain-containing protein [Thermoplasmata archaeon]|nr:CHAD domain-containing protein [Thermoplasmata archaeon]
MPLPQPTARDATALRAEIVRSARRAESGLRSCAYRTTPDPETLHRLHRDLRELRVTHRLLVPVPGSPEGEDVTDRRLSGLGRLVGEVRDRDVAIDLVLRSRGSGEVHLLRGLQTRLRHEGQIGRELLRAQARTELERHLLQTVIRDVSGAQVPAPARLRREMETTLARHHAAVLRAFRRALRQPSTRRLHRLRIALRNAHALRTLVGRVTNHPVNRVPAELEKLQRALGRLHDLDMVTDRIASLAAGAPLEEWERRWRKARKVERIRVLAGMQRKRTRKSLRWLALGVPSTVRT